MVSAWTWGWDALTVIHLDAKYLRGSERSEGPAVQMSVMVARQLEAVLRQ